MQVKQLLVKIGADTKDYKSAMGGALSSLQKHKEQFRKAGMAMTATGGAIIGTFGLMIKSYVQAGDEVHKMAQRTGFSTKALGELKYAAQICGTDLGALEKGVRYMQKAIVEGGEGLISYERGLKRAGLEAKNLIHLKPEEQFFKIANAVAAIENPTLRSTAAQEVFGSRIGTQLLPLFNQGADGLDKLRQKAHELGIVFDQETADRAARLQDAMTTLKSSFQGVFVSVADTVVPTLSNLAEKISTTISKVKEWINAHPALAGMLTKIVLGVGALLTVLGPLVMMLPALAAGFSMLMGPIGIVIAAIAGLTAAGILVVKNWDKISAFLKKIWTGIADTARNVFNGIKKFILDWMTKVTKVLTKVPILKKFAKQWKAGLEEARRELDVTVKHVSEKSKDMGKSLDGTSKESDKLKDASSALGGELESLGDEAGYLAGDFLDAKDKTKTWVDFLKNQGILTVKEKRDRIAELEGYIQDLGDAYRDGKLDLEDYTKSVGLARDEIMSLSGETENFQSVIEDLSGFINDQLNVKLDDAKGKFNLLTLSYEGLSENAPGIADTVNAMLDGIASKTEETKNAVKGYVSTGDDSIKNTWNNVADGIKTKWTTELSAALQGTKDWKDALKAIWDTVKSQFFDMVAEIITKWVFDFLGKILKKTEETTSKIADSFGNMATAASTTSSSMLASFEAVLGVLGAMLGLILLLSGPIQPGIKIPREVQYPTPDIRLPTEKHPSSGGGEGYATGFEGIIKRPIWRKFGEVPEFAYIKPLSELRRERNLTPSVNLVPTPQRLTGAEKRGDIHIEKIEQNIYPQTLTKEVIDESAELLFEAIEREKGR